MKFCLTAILFAAGTLLFTAQHTAAQSTVDVAKLADLQISSPVVKAGGTLFFAAFRQSVGTELWKTDGTPSGTVLVKDIFPGKFNPAIAGSAALSSNPHNLISSSGSLYFFASSQRVFGENDTHWQELWTSDGTSSGTRLVKRFASVSDSIKSHPIVDVDGVVYFAAGTDEGGRELWKSHGTNSTTVMVRDIHRGSGSSVPGELTSFNGKLIFTATDGVNGSELWTSDGTSLGTVMLKDVNAVPDGSSIRDVTLARDRLFFTANDAIHGTELWTSDGTTAGTTMVKDINPGPGATVLRDLTAVNDTLFFRARDKAAGLELWKSDGTEPGTVMVRDINAGPVGSNIGALTNVNGTLFYLSRGFGMHVWKSDGTALGTVVVKTVAPTTAAVSSFGASANVHGQFFVSAETPDRGVELWRSNGAEAGTVLVKDIRGGSDSSFPREFSSHDGVLYFEASTGSGNNQKVSLFRTSPPICKPSAFPGINQRPCLSSTTTGTVIGQ